MDLTNLKEKPEPCPTWFRIAFVALILVGIVLNGTVSWKFFSHNVYRSYDVIFDADPNMHYAYLLGIPGTSLRHPLELFFLHPLATLARHLGATFHLNLNIWLVILLGSFEGALKTIFLALTLAVLGLNRQWQLLILTIDLASLSRMTIGSLPESFPLSAAALMALLWLAVSCCQTGVYRKYRWLLCGLLVAGTTITNLAPFLAVLGMSLLFTGKRLPETLRAVAWMAGAVLACMILLFGSSKVLFHARPMSAQLGNLSYVDAGRSPAETQQTQKPLGAAVITQSGPAKTNNHRGPDFERFFNIQPLYVLSITPLADTYAFMGPSPEVVTISRELSPPTPTAWEQSAPGFGFVMPTHWNRSWIVPVSLVFLGYTLGLCGWLRASNGRCVILAISIILAFNLLLHSLWGGNELYLYVLHWQPALLLLLAGSAFVRSKWAYWFMSALLMAEIGFNYLALSSIFQALG